MYWALMVVGSLRYLSNHALDTTAVPTLSLAVLSALGFAVGSFGNPTGRRQQAALLAMVASWAVLAFGSPSFSWAAIPIFFAIRRGFTGWAAVTLTASITAAVAGGIYTLSDGRDLGGVLGVIGSGLVLSLTLSALDSLLASRSALAAQLAQTTKRLAASERAVGASAERQRVASELHDTVAQGAASALLLVEAAQELWRTDTSNARQLLRQVETVLRTNISDTRRIVHARPLSASTYVLGEITVAAHTAGATVNVVGDSRPVEATTGYELMQVVSEALRNANRHARAHTIVVTVTFDDRTVTVDVGDDGEGFDPSRSASTGYGLRSMRWRMHSVGGTLDVQTAPGRGTVITATIPAQEDRHARSPD